MDIKILKTSTTVTFIFSNGLTVTHEVKSESEFQQLKALAEANDTEALIAILFPELSVKLKEYEHKKDVYEGFKKSKYLSTEKGYVTMPSVSDTIPVPAALAEKISQAERKGKKELLEAYTNFWILCSQNPNTEARENLFWFLKKNGMRISASGLFVGYRNVLYKNKIRNYNITEEDIKEISINYNTLLFLNEDITQYSVGYKHTECPDQIFDEDDNVEFDDDFDGEFECSEDKISVHKDATLFYNVIGNLEEVYKNLFESDDSLVFTDAHSRTFTIKLGKTVSMDRDKCDEDSSVTCSRGLHIGAKTWLERGYFGDVGLMCLINPRDVVAVPKLDHYGKMRTCAYTPVSMIDYNNEGKVVEIDVEDGFDDSKYLVELDYEGIINSDFNKENIENLIVPNPTELVNPVTSINEALNLESLKAKIKNRFNG